MVTRCRENLSSGENRAICNDECQKRRAGRSKGGEIDTRVGGLGDSARVGDFLNMKARSACRGREMSMSAYFQSVCPVSGLVYRIHQMHGGSQLKYS